MSQWRLKNPSSAPSPTASSSLRQSDSPEVNSFARQRFGHAWAFWAVRLTLISFSVLLCYSLGPFGFHGLPAAGIGFLMAMVILLAELRMRHAELSGLIPVILPPGRLKLAISPALTGSAPLTKTMGIVDVAALAASPAAGPPVAAITATRRFTKSIASVGN